MRTQTKSSQCRVIPQCCAHPLEQAARYTPECRRHWNAEDIHIDFVFNSLVNHMSLWIPFLTIPPASLSSQFPPHPFVHHLHQAHWACGCLHGVKLHYTSGHWHWHLVILQWTSFFYNFAGYTLKKELLLLFIECLSFFSLFFASFLSGFYRWSPGMQTGKLPYSIASNNVHRKIAIVIDGNMHVYVQMYVLVCMCICLCVLYVNV